jgi:cytochrome o ubiquinol oxidase operon protein cyoD
MVLPPRAPPTLGSYVLGLALAIGLTAIPFITVGLHIGSRTQVLAVIAVTGLAQAIVHLRYFFHLSFDTSSRENVMVLLFAVLLIVIMAGGTLLIMSDLNARMAA